jgi:hypothetical protein
MPSARRVISQGYRALTNNYHYLFRLKTTTVANMSSAGTYFVVNVFDGVIGSRIIISF